tara:strand:- start:13779 stop:14402 length:624 start_codon:yes stop_codon:yes gene_type:complete
MAQCKIGAKVQRGARLVRQNRKRKQLANITEASDELLPVAAEAPEWALEPTGAAEEFGVPTYSTLQKKKIWDRQDTFLDKFRVIGKPGKAARAVGISRFTVMHWERNDIFGFNERLKVAHADYCETIEQMIDDRLENPQGNRGSDPLLMFKTKAEMPEKYREDVKVIDSGVGALLLDKLKELASKEVRNAGIESPIVEGAFTELDQG